MKVSRSQLYVGIGALALILAGLGLMLTPYTGSFTRVGQPATTTPAYEALAASAPLRLRIPRLSIDTTFVELGLQKNGEIEVPAGYTEVGWYKLGPTPGAIGPAVVLGHVDSYKGPGVFFSLGQLKVGDPVYVDRADGTTAEFRVTSLERYDRDNFPTLDIYGPIPYAGLRLITCSGVYSHASHEYNRVLVIYAQLSGVASSSPAR